MRVVVDALRQQHKVGRDLRKSSLHDRLKSAGAQFSQVFGWERARWYDPTGQGEDFSFKRNNAWNAVRAEALAVRERVGLMDLSTFSKFEVTGPDAHSFLDRICANRLPTKTGGLTLTHLLNVNGFIESEITITRLADDRFYVLSAATAQLHDMDQLRWRLRSTEAATITDVTDAYGTLVLAGPKAREVLAGLTDTDLSNAGFRWLTGKEANVAGVSGIRLLRVNYVGELGWELHCPMADMPRVFDALMAAGAPHGIQLFGTYAMNALRMEKSYRGWGSELTAEIDMFEASMQRFIRLDKPDFIGREASLSRQQRGPRMTLVTLAVDATDSDCMGNEPVYHNDTLAGLTTSGAYGHALNQSLAFAYVAPELAIPGTKLEIALFQHRHTAEVIADSPYDPANERLRA